VPILSPSTSNNNLVLTNVEKHLTLYKGMCRAIGACHRVDECKDIVDKSVALAAHYKQIKDDETVRKFNEVKLRAWRRIGKLFAVVDLSKCETWVAKYKTIRAAFDDAAIAGIDDNRIREILTLMKISDYDFEYALSQSVAGSIASLLQYSPEYQEMLREMQRKEQARYQAPPPKPPTPEEIAQRKENARIAQEAATLEAMKRQHIDEVTQASIVAMKEVGLTLERKDRMRMKQVVFLIKEEVHGVMRQAAFDQKTTMQEVLRRGLKMWLIAHDYKFPEE
jgi:hypothetical protein